MISSIDILGRLKSVIDGSKCFWFSRNCPNFDPSIGRLVLLKSIDVRIQ